MPKDFIWGRADVERTLSGKLVPRKRKLYQLDHGMVHKSYKTYYSIADKMVRIPDQRPTRGEETFPLIGPWCGVQYRYREYRLPLVSPLGD